jgi:presenilin-like A22 family membrane protease
LISLSPFVYLLLLYLVSGLEILAYPITFVLAALFAWMKTWRNNVYVHNFTELFIYGGLAAVIVPVLNMTSVVIIIVIISFYDMYAVWKSKHMVKMAKFQAKEKLFAGLYIPYSIGKSVKKKISGKVRKIVSRKGKGVEKVKTGSAILGGGDIAFPLLFSGVLFKTTGMVFAPVITSLTSMLALGLLFFYSQKKKFYPAMPFIATGLFIGYGLVLLLI